jgi:FixJ family two-component response regulator
MGNPAPRIYLVDDDESLRKAIRRLLRSAGYDVETFPSARSFLDSVPLHDSEGILLLDLRMPEMDGFGLQEELNALRCPLKVIIVTADARKGDHTRAVRSGAVGLLHKPFNDDTLLSLIDTHSDSS